MNSEAMIIISFIFKRSGKDKLKKSEIYLPLSLELGWFSTKESKDFLKYCLQQKLLTEKDGFLSPNFEIDKITIPTGFSPLKKTYDLEEEKDVEEKIDVTESIIQRIVDKTNKKQDTIIGKIKYIEEEKNILREIAALLVAKEYDVEIEDFFNVIERDVIFGNS